MSEIDAIVAVSNHTMALIDLLVAKGVITADEFKAALAKMTAHMDQEMAKKREEALAALGPFDRMLYNLMMNAHEQNETH